MEGSDINPNPRESINEDGTHMIGGIENAEEISLEQLQEMYENTEDGPQREALAEMIRQKTEESMQEGKE